MSVTLFQSHIHLVCQYGITYLYDSLNVQLVGQVVLWSSRMSMTLPSKSWSSCTCVRTFPFLTIITTLIHSYLRHDYLSPFILPLHYWYHLGNTQKEPIHYDRITSVCPFRDLLCALHEWRLTLRNLHHVHSLSMISMSTRQLCKCTPGYYSRKILIQWSMDITNLGSCHKIHWS